jgi:multiple sugar transport system substrate-binding protein
VWDIAMVAYYEPLIERYKEIAPHVTIEMVDLGASGFETILQTQLVGGAEYDLIKIRDIPSFGMHVNADLLMPLDPMLSRHGVNLANIGDIHRQFRVGGNLFSLPFRTDFWLLFYNKDLFDAAGVAYPTNTTTIESWGQIIRRVAHGTGTGRVWGNHFHTWRSTTTLFGVLDGRHSVNDGNYDFLIPYYEFVLALEDGNFVPRRTDLVAGSIHHRNTWAPQQTAMVNMGTWFFADALQSNFRWGIAAYPVPHQANFGNTLGQITQLAIPRSANHPQEAMAFIAFATGAEGAEILARVGQFPAFMSDNVIDVFLSIPGFPQDEVSRGALRPRNIFPEQPPHERAAEINAILNEVHTEIMDRTMTIQQGINMANQRIGRDILGR